MKKSISTILKFYYDLPCMLPDSKIKLVFDMINYIFLIFNILFTPIDVSFADEDIKIK